MSPVFSNGKSLMIPSVRVVHNYNGADGMPIGILNCMTNIVVINPANYDVYIDHIIFANICEYRSKALGLINVIVNSTDKLVIEYTDKVTGERTITSASCYQ